MNQHEITERGPLLNADGSLREPGWSRRLLMDYKRAEIKANSLRIKEWDYYLIYNHDYGVALTVADNSYMSLVSASLLDFRGKPWEQTTSLMGFMPCGKLGLPENSAAGKTSFSNKNGNFCFQVDAGVRTLHCRMDKFKDKKPFVCDIVLTDEPRDSMVIATPFAEKKTAFYYNQKIVGMRARGHASFDGVDYVFDPADSFGLLDWGRGVWTYKNTWYWGGAQGLADGEVFGFNIGYGFGNTDAASENMVFYKGVAHKIDRLTFGIPEKDGKDDFMSPWLIESNDGRFMMKFVPTIDRASKTDVGLICSDQHQIFGLYSGRVQLDDGTVLEIKDLRGFAEKVYNKW